MINLLANNTYANMLNNAANYLIRYIERNGHSNTTNHETIVNTIVDGIIATSKEYNVEPHQIVDLFVRGHRSSANLISSIIELDLVPDDIDIDLNGYLCSSATYATIVNNFSIYLDDTATSPARVRALEALERYSKSMNHRLLPDFMRTIPHPAISLAKGSNK